MATTVANLITAGDQFRRTDEAGTPNITDAKKLEAAALAIEDIHSQAVFRFTQRIQRFDYLKGESDYVMSDNATDFEAAVRIPDFRMIKDLRLSKNHDNDFDPVDPNEFGVIFGGSSTQKVYAVEYRDGAPILRINQPDIGVKTTINAANSPTAGGTWTADTTNGDATNIGTDSKVFINQGSSIKFDADVSQSGNNQVIVETTNSTSVDISDLIDIGVIRMWMYIPDVTDDSSNYVTSVDLRWGSSATAYWNLTVDRPINNRIFQDRWNLLEFNWRDATKTGSPDATTIDSLRVNIAYNASQGDAVGFRINDIRIYDVVEMKLAYFSSFTVRSSTGIGIWEPRASFTADEILAPDQYKNVYLFAYLYYLLSMEKPPTDPDVQHWLQRYKGTYDIRTDKWVGGELQKMIKEQGERIKIVQRKLKPQIRFN